jgi:hypothetical protein
MKEKAVRYLKDQQQSDGSWNYWQKNSKESSENPYPSDIDDTALAFAVIVRADSLFATGERLAQIVHTLTTIEITEGGPYNTWITDFQNFPEWQDCDMVVNANVARMLALLDVTMPRLTDYFDRLIGAKDFQSKYYRTPLSCLYFLSYSYAGTQKAACIDYIQSLKQQGHWQSPLQTALALTALHNFGIDIKTQESPAITFLLNTQLKQGCWPKEALYIERIFNGVEEVQDNICISTAFCLEALSLALPVPEDISLPDKFAAERAIIIDQFLSTTTHVSDSFAAYAELCVEKMLAHAFFKESIVLPYYFLSAQGRHACYHDAVAIKLGLANLYGWIGYSLIDDVLDGERTNEMMPFAIYCIRQCNNCYAMIFKGNIPSVIQTTFDDIDSAYDKELITTLSPTQNGYDIATLPEKHAIPTFQKSFGCALPVICLLLLQGHDEDSNAIRQASMFFQSYLHARQSNDDAHDFLEDLNRGHLTHIGHDLLMMYKEEYPAANEIILEKNEPLLLDLFWNKLFPIVHSEISQTITVALEALDQLSLDEKSYFTALLRELKKANDKARHEHTSMLAFLNSY